MVFNFVGGTNVKNVLILRAFDIDVSGSNPYVNALSVVNNINSELKSNKVNFETDFNFDEQSVINSISNVFENGGKIGKDTLKASNIALDYIYSGGKINRNSLKATWILPLPNNLVNNLTHSYQETSSGIDSSSDFVSFKSNDNKKNKNKTDFFKSIKNNIISDTKKALKETSKNFISSLRRFNMNIDQKIINSYKDTSIRSFNFEFNLIPFSKENSKTIFEGLINLKKFMHGNIMSNSLSMFIHQPTVFTIEFGSRDGKLNSELKEKLSDLLFLNEDIELNLTSMRNSYIGNFIPIINGMPKSFTIGMTFTEKRPYRRDFYKKD